MALNARQRRLLTNAIIAWIQTQPDTWPITLLRATPTQVRNALRPFVQAIRESTIVVQGRLPGVRSLEDVELAETVDDADEVLLDLDRAIVP